MNKKENNLIFCLLTSFNVYFKIIVPVQFQIKELKNISVLPGSKKSSNI